MRLPNYFGVSKHSFFNSEPLNPVIAAALSSQDQLNTYRRDGIKPYHYVIDGRYHATNNPLIFDQDRDDHRGEPGYLQAMSAALKCVVENRGKRLTTDLIKHLHQLATENVLFRKQKINFCGWGSTVSLVEFKPSLRTVSNTPTGFGFDYDEQSSSPEGLAEIKTKYGHFAETDKDRYESFPEECREGGFSNRLHIMKHSDILKEMNVIIDRYYHSKHTNLDIAIFAHEMNLLHPFTDANIRLITFLLVNKLLMDEGRSPIMFVNPNIFDAFSCEQLGEFIDRELKLSGALCQNLNDPFGFNEQCSAPRSIRNS